MTSNIKNFSEIEKCFILSVLNLFQYNHSNLLQLEQNIFICNISIELEIQLMHHATEMQDGRII